MAESENPLHLKYVTWSDISGAKTSAERLKEIASQLQTDRLILAISLIATTLESGPSHYQDRAALHAQHSNLAENVCAPKVAKTVSNLLLTGRRDVFAHQTQLLLAVKLAILFGQPGPLVPLSPEDSATLLDPLGELLLRINDVLELAEASGQTIQQLETRTALRQQAVDRNEQVRYLVGRYYDLLVTRARSYAGPEPRLDLDAAFIEATNLTFDEYLVFSIVYLQPFQGVGNVQQLAESDWTNVLRQRQSLVVTDDKKNAGRRQFIQTKQDLLSGVGTDPNKFSRPQFLPMQNRPLYELEDGSIVPISYNFLLSKFGMGIYWVLHTHYLKTGGPRGVDGFCTFIGALFQDYGTHLLTRTFEPSSTPLRRFYNEQEVIDASEVGASIRPPFDGVIVEGNSLIIVEMTVAAITARTMETADLLKYVEEIQRDGSLISKVRDRLARAVSEIAEGKWKIPDLNLSTIHHVYPVVMLLHPYPQTRSTWEPLWGAFEVDDWLALGDAGVLATQIHRPQIITVEEIEMLEPLLNPHTYTLAQLLGLKLSNPQTAVTSLKNLILSFLSLDPPANQNMLELSGIATERMKHAAGSVFTLT